MRVACNTIEEFLENLKSVEPSSVYGKVVYVSVNRRPLDATDKNKATRLQVSLQASVVIDLDDGQYLLEAGEDCGKDYRDGGGDNAGSDLAAELKDQIKNYCESTGLVVRPGVVSE